MNDTPPATSEHPLLPPPGTTPSEMFPVLTSAQQARVLAHGQRRTVEEGEIVVELNEHVTKVFVVVSGQLHILQVSNSQEHVVAICNPGIFTGELNVLSGRRGLDTFPINWTLGMLGFLLPERLFNRRRKHEKELYERANHLHLASS